MLKEFDRTGVIEFGSGNLPHWYQRGVTYFVTFRLGDSLPDEKLKPWREERDLWLRQHPRPWTRMIQEEYDKRFAERIDRWLDAGTGSCLLADREINRIMEEVLNYGDPSRYSLDSYVIAANHTHAVVEPVEGVTLPQILHTWKSYSAHRIQRGNIWQKESYDHIVRDFDDLKRIRKYIAAHKC